MKRPSKTALLPDGFVDLRQAIDIAGRIEYPDEWTGEEVDAEWDWRYRHNLESCAKQMLEDRVKDRSDFGDSLEEIGEEESLETCKSALLEWDEKRNRPRRRREGVSVRLRQLLHGGLIPSKALLPSGKSIDIDEYVWAGESAPKILETGTVCVENGELRAPAPGGKHSEAAYVLLDRQETERAMKGEGTRRTKQSSKPALDQCSKWLTALMRKDPDNTLNKTKVEIWKEALEKFPDLSKRGFYDSWKWSIQSTKALAWSKPGPRRSN